MYYLKTSAAFDSAHFLAGYEGKCANLHGHRWTIEVIVSSKQLIETGEKSGMVMDFSDLKKAVRILADEYDHAFIYEEGSLHAATVQALNDEAFHLIAVPFRPTAENFAKHFYTLLRTNGASVSSVAVYETPDNCAVYEEEQ